jgi:predicted RNA binding protein YcfA (HicA-like mRNA interferase family)
MVTRDFSGDDVANVLVNVGGFEWVRTNESRMILKWYPPESHGDTEVRTVSVPRHDRLDTGTLKSIADQAGAVDFDSFCRWIDRHR